MEYITGEREEGCFVCRTLSEEDDVKNLIIVRRELAAIFLNRYPYNTGHVFVAPLRHVGEIAAVSTAEHSAVIAAVTESVDALEAEFSPDGFNLGVNLGEVAGAGLPGHYHMHVVPRWSGDTNFMPVVAETKVLPEKLEQTYLRLAARFVP